MGYKQFNMTGYTWVNDDGTVEPYTGQDYVQPSSQLPQQLIAQPTVLNQGGDVYSPYSAAPQSTPAPIPSAGPPLSPPGQVVTPPPVMSPPPTTPNAPLSPPGGAPVAAIPTGPAGSGTGTIASPMMANDPNSLAALLQGVAPQEAQAAPQQGQGFPDVSPTITSDPNSVVQQGQSKALSTVNPNAGGLDLAPQYEIANANGGTWLTGSAYRPTNLQTGINEAPVSNAAADPNTLAALATLGRTDLPPSSVGAAGAAFSPTAGFTQNPDGSWSPPASITAAQNMPYVPNPNAPTGAAPEGTGWMQQPDGNYVAVPTGTSGAQVALPASSYAGQGGPLPTGNASNSGAGSSTGTDTTQQSNTGTSAAQMFNLDSLPTVPNRFDPNFENWYGSTVNAMQGQLQNYWNQAPFSTMNAAQMNTGNVPQVNAQTPESFQALQFLLSGQGFDPATIARMKANAGDSIAQSASGTMSAARLAAERAGLLNSGLGVGLQANVANLAGDQRNQALNNIDIQNALQGISNLTTGTGMELQRQTSAAGMANQVALQNAANMFQAMTANLANQQATNAANFAAQQQRALGQANAQTNLMQGAGQNWLNSATNQYYGANVQNAQSANNQWQSAGNWLNNLATFSPGNPSAGANASNAANTSNTSVVGNTLTGAGQNTTYGG